MTTILVYGWFGRGNTGDELMSEVLCSTFISRGITLKFVDHVSAHELLASDGLIFGGGSILLDRPSIDGDALNMLQKNFRPTFYVGVGLETSINDVHQSLMAIARVVITRSPSPWPSCCPPQTYGMPDLVYALAQLDTPSPASKGLLVIPNVEVVPRHFDPHWKHVSWESFKNEFSQFLDDVLTTTTMNHTFLLMCKNDTMDDSWAASEIIARMRKRSTKFEVLRAPTDSLPLMNIIKDHSVVITQRYHGIVLAQMAGVPHVSIDHHDKLKFAYPKVGMSVPYHGFSKALISDAHNTASVSAREQVRVDKHLYDNLIDAITQIVTQERTARDEQTRGSP